jgi:two-component system sensor histidine kinase CpxA
LLHWIIALVICEALIYALFVLVVSDSHRQYVVRSVGQKTLVAREYVQTAVKGEVRQGAKPAEALKSALLTLAATSGDKVWVAGSTGEIVAASFAGEVSPPATDRSKSGRYREVDVSVDIGPNRATYTMVPLSLEGRSMTLHLLSQPKAGAFPAGAFAGGLVLIGAVLALLAVPLSLRITKPLKRLEASALRIAGGDLSVRAEITGRDMIGKLGAAFNSMAETVERMVRGGKELTANISHELRSPLARIRIAGECLKEALDRGNPKDAQELLQAMWEDIEEADRMIGRILEFSKVDLHEPLPMTEEVAPADIVGGLARTLAPLALSKRIEINLNLDPDVRVQGDEEWLRAAFKNLLENALRHTREGGAVDVSVRREADTVALEVTNPFTPMDREELELIFKPFYRGKVSSGEGSGLGLAIVKKIVGLHYGEVGARNVSKGFQVWVRLPATKQP